MLGMWGRSRDLAPYPKIDKYGFPAYQQNKDRHRHKKRLSCKHQGFTFSAKETQMGIKKVKKRLTCNHRCKLFIVSIDNLACHLCTGCSLSLSNNGTKLCIIPDIFGSSQFLTGMIEHSSCMLSCRLSHRAGSISGRHWMGGKRGGGGGGQQRAYQKWFWQFHTIFSCDH